MNYSVTIEFSPAYELIVSLQTYLNKTMHKGIDLGPAWVRAVSEGLSPEFARELQGEKRDDLPFGLALLLVTLCPVEQPKPFLRWFSGLSDGDLYELLAPACETVPRDLGAIRDRFVRLLSGWNEAYFSFVDPRILEGLAADAEAKRHLQANTDPIDLVELATHGIRQLPTEGLQEVVLIPQYHAAPFNNSYHLQGRILTHYPADALPLEADQPSTQLMRVIRGLADESRLRILRLLAVRPRGFSDLVTLTGLAKSTVHHHVVALRAAGLVRVTATGGTVDEYALREETVHGLTPLLLGYLNRDPEKG
jgi:DNA-binding transcriptional ArsR family regulator